MGGERYGMNSLNLLIPITAITILGLLLCMGTFDYEPNYEVEEKCKEHFNASTKICNRGNI